MKSMCFELKSDIPVGVFKQCMQNVLASTYSIPSDPQVGANCVEMACKLWKVDAQRSLSFTVISALPENPYKFIK